MRIIVQMLEISHLTDSFLALLPSEFLCFLSLFVGSDDCTHQRMAHNIFCREAHNGNAVHEYKRRDFDDLLFDQTLRLFKAEEIEEWPQIRIELPYEFAGQKT